MFLQVSVILFTRGGVWSRGVPGPGGSCPGGCLVWGGLVPWGAWSWGGVWSRGVPGGDPCGRYASYWNVFLLLVYLDELKREETWPNTSITVRGCY